MASYTTVLVAAVLVVTVTLLIKLQSLNTELQNQMMKHETMKKSLREDAKFCEQRNANYREDLEREVAAKMDMYKKKSKAEADAVQLQSQLKRMEAEISGVQDQMQVDKLALQTNYENVQEKLKEALANVEATAKERDDAKKEVEKYHNLYVEGNKLLNTARQECEMMKMLAAKQIDGGQVSKVKPVVIRETTMLEPNPAADTKGKMLKQEQDRNEANEGKQEESGKNTHLEDKKTNGENGKEGEVKREVHEEEEARKKGKVEDEEEKETENAREKAMREKAIEENER